MSRTYFPSSHRSAIELAGRHKETHSNVDEERTERIQVLVVDDEPSMAQLITEVLSAAGHNVTWAMTGKAALSLIKQRDFDVALIDKRLPDTDGDVICRQVRTELAPMLPVIVVTGCEDRQSLQDSFEAGANDFIRKPFSTSELRARVDAAARSKRQTDQLECAESLLFAIARSVEARDTVTSDHCSRLSALATAFGNYLGLGARQIRALQHAGLLHDIGKLGIADRILFKEGALDAQERRAMQEHTVIGAELCSRLKTLRPTACIVRHHHERRDGGGYPDKLARTDIPLLARIFQLADIYDALVSARPYKEAMSSEAALSTMLAETRAGWLVPNLFALFLEFVKLDDTTVAPRVQTTAANSVARAPLRLSTA